MTGLYLWLKALHVIAVVAWMAGLFYLPRLFVYHANSRAGGELSETLKVMERRLAGAIMLPALALSWASGLAVAWVAGYWEDLPGWLLVKLLAVLLLTGFHVLLLKHLRQFARDERPNSEGYFRAVNEVPTLLLVIIVVMVVVKPL
jgi:protoporphyrinogen IX oxidase